MFLPGSRDEKVSYLGAALQNFSRLKNLDLSSNALVSLEGLHSLDGLEKLNLYFNRLPDLTELFRLRHNRHLVEVDLRLNPVATQDPQYRLFLVHLLPMLQRLDDMAVMSSERAAAAGIFTTVRMHPPTQCGFRLCRRATAVARVHSHCLPATPLPNHRLTHDTPAHCLLALPLLACRTSSNSLGWLHRQLVCR